MHHAGRALAFSLLMWPSALAAADPPLPGGGREPDLHAAGPPFPSPKPAAPPDRDRPVSRREIEALRREISEETRSSLTLRFDVHEETGDLNNELGFLRFGARFDLKWRPSTTVSLGARRTPYRTQDDAFRSTGTEVTLGLRRRDSPRREWQVEGAVARFGGRDWSVTGLAAATFHPSEALRWSVGLERTNVEESLLSVAGLRPLRGPFAGARVGGVYDNRLASSASYRLPARFDVYGEAAVGSRAGSEVERNVFVKAGGGLGYAALARAEDRPLSFLRVSLAVDYFGFDEDRLGYGGASLLDARYRPVPPEALGSDGISPVPSEGNPGVGGYFSPQSFVSRGFRVEARGRPKPKIDYGASVFLGRQSFTGVSPRRTVGVAASVRLRLSESLSLPVAYAWDDVGPFAQQSLVARLVMLF